MSTSGLQAAQQPDVKELDSMKESISDIINQLQDIDPTRLSFSPFLDLDTQISLAPVSDSPESSVEELHSACGSQRSLEPAARRPRSPASFPPDPHGDLPPAPRGDREEEAEPPAPSCPIVAAENSAGSPPPPTPASRHADLPNGTGAAGWSPEEAADPDRAADECRPLIGPESVELTVWSPEGRRAEAGGAPEEAPARGPRRRRCPCCLGGRVPAALSAPASLLCAAGLLYALYFYVPLRPPDCGDLAGRVAFALCCCAAATAPVLLVMLLGAAGQFCSASFDPLELPRRRALQQLFVTATAEQLLLYTLNLVVMAALLPPDRMKLVPVLVAMFIFGRLVYWLSLNACSSWRGFGSGLTVFPLLAMAALNAFLVYRLLRGEQPAAVSRDDDLQVNPSAAWSGATSQSPPAQ
ncbi:transmembrane protein 79-like [Pseudoliparis swirei]|uniref:transmembrane protein 79-like n=1 Tax=Pseudoliparis swirei TaxID=2059687 RepID=UPI0024BEF93A|nr:transmembrane protein 79-like [Pseudoliparis swirei]